METSVATWNIENSRKFAQMAMDEGICPETAIDEGLAKGMEDISTLFDDGKIFLPQILMASKAMEAALDVIEPYMKRGDVRLKGVIVMGSVKGDIHSIGKNVCCAMLRGAGFKVVDLGADVSGDTFIAAAKEEGADIIGGSALMTVSLPQQREMVRVFKEEGLSVLTIFGGAPCSEEWVQEIGGDGYSASAGDIVKLVRKLLDQQ
ncbi:MAG: cobalamin-dependent protein [Thermoplasmata archaeon]|nr:cobalamin-dependent protein [Thermoplasmata archaeon]